MFFFLIVMYSKKLHMVYSNKIFLLVIIKVIFTNADSGTRRPNTDQAGILNQVGWKFFGSADTEFPNIPHRRFGSTGSNYLERSPFFQLGYEKRVEFQDQFPIWKNHQRFYQEGEHFQRSLFIEHPVRESSSRQADTYYSSRFKEGYSPNLQKNSNEINQQTSKPDDVLYFNKSLENNGAINNGLDLLHRVSNFPQPFEHLTKRSQNPIRSDDFKPDLSYINMSPVFNTKSNFPFGNNRYLGNRKAIYHKLRKENYLLNTFAKLRRDNSNIKTVIKNPKFLVQQNSPINEEGLNMGQIVQSHNRIPMNPAILNNYDTSNRNFTFYWKNQSKLPHKAEFTSDKKVAILGKPVLVPTETTSARETDNESSKNAVKKQCVQDCESTSEYNPVCGTDSVTYINPGKFACARNCGIDVKVSSYGSCDDSPVLHQ